MKITFNFTDSPNIKAVPSDGIYSTHFEIPDEAMHLIGYEERIMAVAQMVGHLTNACLFITCKELNLKNHLVKTGVEPNGHTTVYGSINTFTFYFERFSLRRSSQQRQLKILSPVSPLVPQAYLIRRGKNSREKHTLRKNLLPIGIRLGNTEAEIEHSRLLNSLTEQLLVLLNAEPGSQSNQQWTCLGFHPRWVDSALIDLQNARSKKRQAARNKQEREEAKRKVREEKLALKPPANSATTIPKTGAGRRPGAIPGVFMGIQFRSQLEIRFATELESRQIRWVYEVERLGDGNYLVDFYLPDHKCWVEVKGKFEPRDDYLLKDTAIYLARERGERLFVYTAGKPLEVDGTSFKQLSRDAFWEML
jgi:hypothetical protein